ncbi:RNA polymerase II transcription elongation factor SpEAF [Amphichorda felina]
MSEVGLTDLSKLLHSKRGQNNAIVASRKRKLREVFAVATHADSQSHDAFANPDAPPSTPAEGHFLQANEIFQGKKLNEQTIPPHQPVSLNTLHRSIAILGYGAPGGTLPPALEQQKRNVSSQNIQRSQPPKPTQPASKLVTPASAPPRLISPIQKGPPAPVARPLSTAPSAPSAPAAPALPAAPAAPAAPALAPTDDKQPVTTDATPATTQPPKAVPVSTSDGRLEKPISDMVPTQQPPAQGNFPPATNGSPNTGTEPTTETISKTEKDKPAIATPSTKAEETGPRNGVSTDIPRTAEAPSSPESTIPSATTPVVHDASTDTSPDNAGPIFSELPEAKDGEEAREAGVDARRDLLGANAQEAASAEVVESAEDQLLQESLQSSAAASIPDVGADATDATAKVPQKPDSTKVEAPPQPKDASEELAEAPVAAASSRHESEQKLEIPDSREDTPERMVVDEPKVQVLVAPVSAPAPRNENVAPAEAPSTPATTKLSQKEASEPPQRAVTRVSSGAMRPKSVNEIVGGPIRQSGNFDRPFISKDLENQLTPLTSTSQSPTSRSRRVSSGRKERAKGQVSTVLFGKQPKRIDEKAIAGTPKETIHPSDDYYTPLFIQGFARSSNWMQPLEKILFHANKTVEPLRPVSHTDLLLKEMKWMRTDFREERKWRMAVARNLAQACVDWCEASPEERQAMQVPAMIPPKPSTAEDVTMTENAEGDDPDNEPTPDLVPGDVDSPLNAEELSDVFPETISPSAIFALQEDDVVFGLRRTAAAEELLGELPMYASPLKVPRVDPITPDFDPDAHWRRPALPLSKFVEGQMKLASEGPPRKRSRYNYHNEGSDDDSDVVFGREQNSQHDILPPSTDEVSLFRPEMKHIRDRLHAGHQFRPPTDQPMPGQSFYECRHPSMWTLAEDDELRSLVREHSYNWPLISSMLTSKSMFSSGAERRTPWECFERWINLEGLPSDMQKTQYFKAYNNRIEAAQRVVMQNQLAAQQATAAGGQTPPIRRRQTTPIRVERRRNQKHLTLIDAMRKLAKKRETTIQKQQHNAAQNAANKKNNTEGPAQRPNKTPREYSLLRWERDQALAEKMAVFAHRQDANRRAALMQARAQGQGAQGQPGTPGLHPAQNSPHPNVGGASGAARPNQAAGGNAIRQAQARVPLQAPPNGMAGAGGPSPLGATPNAPMGNGNPQQSQMQGMHAQQRMPMAGHQQQQPDPAMMMRAQRISEQQRQAVQMQQAHQHQHQQAHQHQQQHQGGGPGTPRPPSQHNSPPNMANGVNGVGVNNVSGVNGGVNGTNGLNHQNFMNNGQTMMTSFNNASANGHTSPAASLFMAAGSPGSRPLQVPPAFHAHINQLEAQLRAKNPSMKPETARQMAMDHMARAMLQQRQSAMSAAAGAAGQQHGIANNIATTTSPHQYAALLRQQQQQQAAAQSTSSPGQSSHHRQSSEGATPGAAQ